MMRFGARVAVAGLLGVCAAGGASAQMPSLGAADEKAIVCIYERLDSQARIAVASAEIGVDDTARDAADKALLDGHAACKATLRGDERRTDIAEEVAVEESIIDMATAKLKADGFKSPEKLYDVWRALKPADQAYFLDPAAPDDEAFRSRMRKLLVKIGLPDNDNDLDGGLLVMECITRVADQYRTWQALGASPTH